MRPGLTAAPVAVIDIGSNSGRVVVYEILPEGHLRILASSRASLRLVRDLKERNTLSPQAINRTLDALHDFHALAVGSGASRTLAVATSAIRDAENGAALLTRVRRGAGAAPADHLGRARRRATAAWAPCAACRSKTG